jgi:phosphate starvation-inducible membrane PsiE
MPQLTYTAPMSDDLHQTKPWTSKAARYLQTSESAVLVLIGAALVMVAVLLLYSSMHDLLAAAEGGPKEIEHKSIEILNTVLLVMMTMEIVYTVAISLESHTLNAEPFLIIGSIAGIRRMLVITATSTESETNPAMFHNTLVELGLLAATVVAMAVAICILRFSQRRYVDMKSSETAAVESAHS